MHACRFDTYLRFHVFLHAISQVLLTPPYDDVFRRKHKLYLSILKQFGFGQREMETVINANIEHFVVSSKATGGRAFDPTEKLQQSIFGIITSLVFGNRFPYGHPTLYEVSQMLHKYLSGFVLQLDFLPSLRFVPPFRRMIHWAVTNHQELLNTLDKMVGILVCAEECICWVD